MYEEAGIPRAVPIWFGAFALAAALAAVVHDAITGWLLLLVFLAGPGWVAGRWAWPHPRRLAPLLAAPLVVVAAWILAYDFHASLTQGSLGNSVGGSCVPAGPVRTWNCEVSDDRFPDGVKRYRVSTDGSCWTGLGVRGADPAVIHGCVTLRDRL